MRRFIAFFIAILMIVSLCACEKTEELPETTHHEHQSTEETLPEGKVAGQIYAVFGNESDCATEFVCNEKVTPSRICAGLTGWTGLKFRTSVTVDEENKIITVEWLEDSSFFSGTAPETQKEPFIFENAETLRMFMLNSLVKSITANLGEYEIFFSVTGKDSSEFGLNGVSADTPFSIK